MEPYKAYCRYYQAQSGGEIPVFRGGHQNGEGLGDFFRGLLRFVAPIAMRGISTFAGSMLDSHKNGATLKNAAKQALKPTLGAVATSFTDQLNSNQSGSGALRKRNWLGHKPSKRADVYKKSKRKRKSSGLSAIEHQHLNF